MSDETNLIRVIKEQRRLIQLHKIKFPEHTQWFDTQLSILEQQLSNNHNLNLKEVESALYEINFLKDEFDNEYIPDIHSDHAIKPFDSLRDLIKHIEKIYRI